ncbi:hypothetical protein [Cognatilysobacter bugurensis]|uniref:Uncharacterized protein n=1 Tax=Cognatilysobacter bugurensis TaxID=543356 RepID=A0A918SWE2_9GAMM|nr:hypothetical protein [Lysobacter bugurensis]GHA75016.1 hypothetical protein GCM10007067_10130 [Lysobacter bugurensis]
MKQVSAKATMRRDVVERVFGSADSGRDNLRQFLMARERGQEVVKVGDVTFFSKKQGRAPQDTEKKKAG